MNPTFNTFSFAPGSRVSAASCAAHAFPGSAYCCHFLRSLLVIFIAPSMGQDDTTYFSVKALYGRILHIQGVLISCDTRWSADAGLFLFILFAAVKSEWSAKQGGRPSADLAGFSAIMRRAAAGAGAPFFALAVKAGSR